MPTEIRLNRAQPLAAQADKGHNRWHPDLAPVASVAPGEAIVIDTLDASDGQVTPATADADLASLSANRGHPLTGPVAMVRVMSVVPERYWPPLSTSSSSPGASLRKVPKISGCRSRGTIVRTSRVASVAAAMMRSPWDGIESSPGDRVHLARPNTSLALADIK